MAGERILIVEDSQTISALIAQILRGERYEILQAATGKEGARLAIEGLPDLILMDIQLPDVDGLTVAAALKRDARTKDIPIVAITGSEPNATQVKAISQCCIGYIQKPVPTRTLAGMVGTYLLARKKPKG